MREPRRRMLITSIVVLAMIFSTAFAFAGTETSRYTGTSYIHNAKFDNCIIVDGLDVSIYQYGIDWQKAKADGVDYAIIRVAGRGYGSEGKMYSDDNFVQNMAAAKAAGVMVGVYFFSQAINEIEAIAEARYAVKLIEEAGYTADDVDLPVFMDYEFSGGSAGRLTKAKLTKAKATKVARAFCDEVTELGYKPGIYANLNFLNNTIDGAALGKDYPIWVAQYYKQCDYENDYQWWQYSSGGTVNGISAKNDCNFWYINPNPAPTSSFSLANASAGIVGTGTFTYDNGRPFEPQVSVSEGGRVLTEGVDYKVRYVNNTQAGTGYAMIMGLGMYTDYCMVPFTIKPATDFSDLVISEVADRIYTGSVTKPTSLTIKDANGRKLKHRLEYTFTASNATNAGTASLNVKLTGNYSGTKTVKYNILKGQQTISVKNDMKTVGIEQPDYNLGVSLKFDGGKVTYSSSNKDVATVSSSGTVSIKKQGTTDIKITAAGTSNFEGAAKTIKLTVTKPVQTVTTKYRIYNKTMASKPFKIAGAATDGDGRLSYFSSDEEVAVVDRNGVVTVKGAGQAIITVTASETSEYAEGSKEITVNVDAAEQTVTTSFTRYKRHDLDPRFNLNAKTTGDGKITYESSDESVAKINSRGNVAIVGPGEVEFTVRAEATENFEADEKTVYLTVEGFDSEEERELAKEEIFEGVKNTKVVDVKATGLKTKVRLDWKKSRTDYAVDCYQVYRSTKKSTGYKKIYTSADAKKLYVINSKNVEPDTTYWYKIRGVRFVDGKLAFTPFTRISAKTL